MSQKKKARKRAQEAELRAQLGIAEASRTTWVGFRPSTMRSGNTYSRQRAKASLRAEIKEA